MGENNPGGVDQTTLTEIETLTGHPTDSVSPPQQEQISAPEQNLETKDAEQRADYSDPEFLAERNKGIMKALEDANLKADAPEELLDAGPPKEPEPDPAPQPAPEADPQPAPAEQKADDDEAWRNLSEDDLKLPENETIKDKVRVRFDKLQKSYHNFRDENEKLRGYMRDFLPSVERYEKLDQAFTRVRAQPEQVAAMMEVMGGINSGDPTALRHAKEILQGQLHEVNTLIGDPEGAAANILDRHKDLAEEVANGDITEAIARRTAMERERFALTARDYRGYQESQRQTQRSDAEAMIHARGIESLNTLGDSLEKEYGDKFQKVRDDVTQYARELMEEQIDPRRWAPMTERYFKRLYATAPAPAPAPAQQKAATTIGRSARHELMRPGVSPGNGAQFDPRHARSVAEGAKMALRNAGLQVE